MPTLAIVKRVFREHGRPHAKAYAVVLVFMAIVAACTSLSAWVMKDLINAGFVGKENISIYYFPLIISALFLVKGLFSYLQEVGTAKIGARIVADVQRNLYDHLLGMNLSFFQTSSSGELIARMSNGSNAVRDAINLTMVSLGRDLLTVIGLCIVMIWQDPILFMSVIVAAPPVVFILRRLSVLSKSAARQEVQGFASIISLTRETVQGIRMIKSFQLEKLLQGRMLDYTQRVEKQRTNLARLKAAVSPVSEVLSGLAIGAAVLYAAYKARENTENIGTLFSFITALLLAGEPLRRLSRLHVDLATASERISHLYAILDQKRVELASDPRPDLKLSSCDIAFDDVSFSYNPGSPVLRGLDLEIEGGKTTALVGHSGGGKTTILALIQALVLPTKGTIKIDGQSLDGVSLASVRQSIAYLDQDAFLFEGSVEDNIVGSCADRDQSRIFDATKFAGADDFIKAMPQGYQTDLRELASNLSGGQRQRMAIARAFYKNAPILLLDEPTSALDSRTEEHIRQAIFRLASGRTTVIVAHRLSTIREADKICVIDQGRVIEQGTHDELVAKGGAYTKLIRGQDHM